MGPSAPEAAQVALCLANLAWNESVGLDGARDGYRAVWEEIETQNPEPWNEFKSIDIDAVVDKLMAYKVYRYREDQRRILGCGFVDGNVRVEWLPAVAPGVDSKWEMQLYGLVRTDRRAEAIQFLQKTRGVSRKQAEDEVARITAELRNAKP